MLQLFKTYSFKKIEGAEYFFSQKASQIFPYLYNVFFAYSLVQMGKRSQSFGHHAQEKVNSTTAETQHYL